MRGAERFARAFRRRSAAAALRRSAAAFLRALAASRLRARSAAERRWRKSDFGLQTCASGFAYRLPHVPHFTDAARSSFLRAGRVTFRRTARFSGVLTFRRIVRLISPTRSASLGP